MSAAELVEAAARRLAAAGSTSSRLDAQLLLGHATSWSRTELLAHPRRPVALDHERVFEALVERRAAGEPIAYLMGEREFYGRVFRVDQRALIPRPETELLVDLGISAIAKWCAAGIVPTVIDVGTGCGAIAVSLAAECKVGVVATDLSSDALALAKENVTLHQADVRLVQTDLLAGVRGPLHALLANLPYVPRDRVLPPDVRDYEPSEAIFGGERGTEVIERLLDQAKPLLAPGAEVGVELDEEEQSAPMAALARQLYPGAEISVFQDAGGYDRVLRIVAASA